MTSSVGSTDNSRLMAVQSMQYVIYQIMMTTLPSIDLTIVTPCGRLIADGRRHERESERASTVIQL